MMKRETINLLNFRANFLQFEGIRPTPCYGEDGVFRKIFEIIETNHRPKVIEFGEHRVLGTTSRYLRIEKFAKSLYFSGDYDFNSFFLNLLDIFKIARKRSLRYLIFLFNLPSKKVATADNIAKLIKKFGKKSEIDLLVVDIDSFDYEIVHSILSKKIYPKVLVVEYNPSLKHSMLYLSKQSASKIRKPRQYGASYLAQLNLIEPFGYKLVHITGFCNLIFVRKEFSDFFEGANLTELTLDSDSIIKYCEKWCLSGFRPSWLSSAELTKEDLIIFNQI